MLQNLGAPALAQGCSELSPIEGPTGYRARDASARCEGLFAARVAGGGIDLVSLTLGPVFWDFATDRSLTIAPVGWNGVGRVQLRAVGIPIGLYYRLDAQVPADAQLHVSLDAVLRPEHIGPEDIGFFAFRALPGQALHYLPVRVQADRSSQNGAVANLIATLRPSEPVSEIGVRLTPSGGEVSQYVEIPGVAGLIPAGRRLDILLGQPLPAEGAALFVTYIDQASGRQHVERYYLDGR
jgi:hypothetical protein